MLSISPGAAVLVAGDALDPVARFGQWALLASEEVAPNDEDLVAAEDTGANRICVEYPLSPGPLLRRRRRHRPTATAAMASTTASREAGFVRWAAKPASRLR